MSTNNDQKSKNDQSKLQELQTLRTLRASLTSVDIFTKKVLQDLEIMARNYEAISVISYNKGFFESSLKTNVF
ncbi:hypothetical protein RIR_jg33754.t1 [Rhizophagus irregularis DAOM 181602=DAOM 197198]|nr:hypothetical protein RIR_jg33754.t1 [Rhizophagus irregularis DAOM 181602=DAOM 197198]